jgi:hypothetical protein
VNDSFLSAFLLSAPVSSFSGRPLTLLGERVKSAVVHLMALAHASIVSNSCWAASAPS